MAAIALSTKRNWLLHPLTIATAVWLSVFFLYSLQLSSILQYTGKGILPTVAAIWVPLLLVTLVSMLLHPKALPSLVMDPNSLLREYSISAWSQDQIVAFERRLKSLFYFWVACTILETIVSRGIPLTWLYTDPSKSYFDYGIPSVHGFVISLMEALSLAYYMLFLLTGEKKHLRYPIFTLFWCLALVTRGTIFIMLVEYAVLTLRLRPVRVKTLINIGLGAVMVILVFGWLGDLRSGAERFRQLARPTSAYPAWLPSGALWAYIYITTPVNNLVYTMDSAQPSHNWLLPHMFATLLPSVLRNLVYGGKSGASEFMTGTLVESNFNVSTAYLGIAQDFGLSGIFVFSLCTAIVCQFFWFRKDTRSQLIFAVLAQCLILGLFYDLFLSLPVITQILWFWIMFQRNKLPANARRTLQ